jgi:hypothetical protein
VGFVAEEGFLSTAWRLAADPAVALVGLIGLALVVGGGGVSAAFGNLGVQLFALAALALHARSIGGFLRWGPRSLALLVGACCLLPLIQLVPLPPSIWTGLPGRELVAQSLDLAGGRGWFSLSVDPGRTLVAFLGTLAPATIIAIGCGLAPERLVFLQRAVIAMGLVIALFGATHLLNVNWGDLYASRRPMPGILVGTFADRNAAALFFDLCLLLLVGLPTGPRRSSDIAIRVASGAFLALCVVLTGSRTGMVLLGAPALLLGWRVVAAFFVSGPDQRASRTGAWTGAALLVAVLAIGLVVSSGRGQASLSRFDDNDGMRAEMREDARFVAGRYWPVGAGMGTFDEVFQVDESLEYVSPRRAGRAHMDYLELAIEAGIAGALLAAGWLAWTLVGGWRALRRRGSWPARAATLGILSIAAQSLLAFPLRNQAMLCVAAMAIVLIARSPVAAVPRSKDTP